MNTKQVRVLLIDDDDDDNYIHKRILERSRFVKDVLISEDGSIALNLLREKLRKGEALPEIIFLDINMPVMTGWEFLEQIDKHHKDDIILQCAIVAMLTTSSNPDDKTRAMKYSFVKDYFNKPLTQEIFENVFEKNFGK